MRYKHDSGSPFKGLKGSAAVVLCFIFYCCSYPTETAGPV